MRNSWMKCAVFSLLGLALVSCMTTTTAGLYGSPLTAPVVVPGAGAAPSAAETPLITDQQEIDLGRLMAGEVDQRKLVKPDSALQSYVQAVGERLAASSPRQDVTYVYIVIDSPDTINAFSLPNGNVYVYTGLMKLAANEAELASLLAHETAQVALHHHALAIARHYGFEILTRILIGQRRDDLVRLVSGLTGEAALMRFTPEEEQAADTLGMEMLVNAGYNPAAMISFYQKMFEASGKSPNLPIFALHPYTQERMASLQALLQAFPSAVMNPLYTARYQDQALSKIY